MSKPANQSASLRAAPHENYPAGESDVFARDVVIAGERVRIVEAGRPGDFSVVLLHGWGASAYNFRGILASLGRAGFHAIAPDLRGHGWSETQFPPGAWTTDAMAGWVKDLLDFLGVQRCVLVGQSIGGALALDAASLMPARIAGLVLLAPIGFTPVRRVALARMLRWWLPATRHSNSSSSTISVWLNTDAPAVCATTNERNGNSTDTPFGT